MSINKDFIVFSLTDCPYCLLAANLLIEKGASYVKFIVDDLASNTDKAILKESVSKMVNQEVKTFPIIFTSEMEFIGGYDDLEHFIHKLSLNAHE